MKHETKVKRFIKKMQDEIFKDTPPERRAEIITFSEKAAEQYRETMCRGLE